VAHSQAPKLADTKTTLGSLGPRIYMVAGGVGLVALAASVALGLAKADGLRHFGFSYLVSYAYFLGISLGALVFVALQHVTRSSWSVVIRRLPELMAANLVVLAVLALPILLNLSHIYAWASGHVPAEQAALLAHKALYLNKTFFTIRWVVYFVAWIWLAFYFWRKSLRQDETGEVKLTKQMENLSGFALVVFALTCSFAGMDLLMTLDFAWFSTMFGVYYFATGFVTFCAVLTLVTLALQSTGRLENIVSGEHLHDYGKLMFAFTFFWAYIAFSQYMLYWYANIPEETVWYLVRSQNGWGRVGVILIFFTWLAPFLGLISRFAKRSRKLLAVWAVWIVIAQWVNVYWLAMPVFSPDRVRLDLLDVTCFVGIGGVWLATLALLAGNRSLVPTQDPRLRDSLNFENA